MNLFTNYAQILQTSSRSGEQRVKISPNLTPNITSLDLDMIEKETEGESRISPRPTFFVAVGENRVPRREKERTTNAALARIQFSSSSLFYSPTSSTLPPDRNQQQEQQRPNVERGQDRKQEVERR